jgi:hypothetical protein
MLYLTFDTSQSPTTSFPSGSSTHSMELNTHARHQSKVQMTSP